MTQVIKIVTFIRAKSSLKHHQFKSFLGEVKSQYGDLQLYNKVVEQRFCTSTIFRNIGRDQVIPF